MISFRFHVVSITAVFLAIAIGVVVGTTYVDGAVVEGLRTRIGSVSNNLDALKGQNDRLDRELATARDYISSSADYAVTDRLPDVPVLVVATRGIDETAVEDLGRLLRRAGATMPGIVWVEARSGLASDDDRVALAALVGARPSDADEALWSAAWTAVVDELLIPPVSRSPQGTTTTTVVEAPSAPVLLGLVSEGFLSVDSLGDDATSLLDLAGTSPRLMVLTGTRAATELTSLLPVVVAAAVDGELPTVVADVHVEAPEAPPRASALRDLLTAATRETIALVDDAERVEGQVAAVLALDEVVDGGGRHYGYGDGADGVLPSWTPP